MQRLFAHSQWFLELLQPLKSSVLLDQEGKIADGALSIRFQTPYAEDSHG